MVFTQALTPITPQQKKQLDESTITLFLCLYCNFDDNNKTLADKIRKCAKIANSKTSDIPFKAALKAIRSEKNHELVIRAVTKAADSYALGKRL